VAFLILSYSNKVWLRSKWSKSNTVFRAQQIRPTTGSLCWMHFWYKHYDYSNYTASCM